jgi:glycolate oxidase FAD binding subunit
MADAAKMLRPAGANELIAMIAQAVATGIRLSIRGGGSKDAVGAPCPDARVIDMRGFAGIIDYDPDELVLTAGAATPLSEVKALLASKGQMLAFDPFDHGPLFDADPAAATLGGVIAAGVAGSQRLSQGGARDNLLGFTAVSGHAERFVAGARVVKNVTGFDLPKLAAGSWGRLFAMTELTVRVAPAPREIATVVLEGLEFATARNVMARALGSAAEVAAAAYLPAAADRLSQTALRVQGFGPSVAARVAMLQSMLRDVATAPTFWADDAKIFWDDIAALRPLAGAGALWRINLAPSRAPALVAALAPGSAWLADWGGGLVWLAGDRPAESIREAAALADGHATLVRAPASMRAAVPTFQPPTAGVAALERRLRRAFDPAGVFETGRFGVAAP